MQPAHAFTLVLFVTMGTVLLLALVSEALRNRFIASEPIFAVGIGALVGPHALDVASLDDLTRDVPRLLEELARITLAVAILTATLRVGWPWARRHLRDLALVLLVVLPMMWALSFVALHIVLPTAVLTSLVIAAVVTPTDPVLAQAIVTSTTAEEKVPADLRHLLSAESAANDGLALLFVMVCVLLLGPQSSLEGKDLIFVVVWEILGALVVGACAGWLAGRLMAMTAGSWASETGLLGGSLALAVVTLSGLKLLHMDGIFGVFAAGLAMSAALGEEHKARHVSFNHTVAEVFHLPLLVLLGMALPIDAWQRIGWPLLGAVALVLLLRRLPIFLVIGSQLRSVGSWQGALFAGWFGPIGIAALFYAMLVLDKTGSSLVFAVTSAVITGSVVVHGLTDTIGSKLLGRTVAARPVDGDTT